MTCVRTREVSESRDSLPDTYRLLHEMFGMVPKVFSSMTRRPDLLEPIVLYVKRLMIEDHGLSRVTKELLAAYVSKLSACAY